MHMHTCTCTCTKSDSEFRARARRLLYLTTEKGLQKKAKDGLPALLTELVRLAKAGGLKVIGAVGTTKRGIRVRILHDLVCAPPPTHGCTSTR